MTLAIDSSKLQPSLVPSVIEGLDLGRTVPGRCLGTHVALKTAIIQAGMGVARDSDGFIIPATGAGVFGIAKWNKATQLFGSVKDEAIVLTATDAIPLKHPLVAKVLVTNLAGVAYTVTTDYTVNATNGTVTRVALGGIADGETVLVSYRFTAQASDLEFHGRNFFNLLDETALQQGRMAVIEGLSQVFTGAYNTGVVWAINDSVYCGTDSYVTNVANGPVIGKVIQAPTADDPFLGYTLNI